MVALWSHISPEEGQVAMQNFLDENMFIPFLLVPISYVIGVNWRARTLRLKIVLIAMSVFELIGTIVLYAEGEGFATWMLVFFVLPNTIVLWRLFRKRESIEFVKPPPVSRPNIVPPPSYAPPQRPTAVPQPADRESRWFEGDLRQTILRQAAYRCRVCWSPENLFESYTEHSRERY